MSPISTSSGGWVLRAAAIVMTAVLLAAPPAAAQNSEIQDLRKRIVQMEGKLADMRSQLRSKRPGSVRRISGEVPPTLAAQFEVRLNELERAIQKLTGKVEDLAHLVNTANTKAEKSRSDIEFRLDRLEKGDKVTGATRPNRTADATRPNRTDSARRSTEPTTPKGADRPFPRTGAPPAKTPQSASLPSNALPPGTPSQQYAHAKGLLRKGEFDSAAQSLLAFIKAYPTGPLTGNAYYWLGETYYVRGRFREAAVQFADGYQKFSKHPKAPDNLLKLGMSLSRLNKRREACASFIELRRRYPGAGRYVLQTARNERRRLGCG